MKKAQYILFTAMVVASIVACSKLSLDESRRTSSDALEKGVVSMNVAPIVYDGTTRTSVTADELSGLSFFWSETDTVGIYSDEGGFSRYVLTSGAGASSARFDGQGFALLKGHTYDAVYPYALPLNGDQLPVNYSGRKITGVSNVSDLLGYDPLYSSTTAEEDATADFEFNHISSFGRVTFTMPKAGTFNRLDIVPTYGDITTSGTVDIETGEFKPSSGTNVLTIPVEGVTTSSNGEEIALWVPFAPQDFSGKDWAAIMYGSDGKLYTGRLSGRNMRSGTAYRWTAGMPEFSTSEKTSITASNVTETTLSNLPSGQYSGITKISDNQYAIVHDKKNGGGFYIVTMKFNTMGGLNSYSYQEPEGVSSATACRDPEGIAFFRPKDNPTATGTLFVSGEGDQKILEYSLDGTPTGRELEVPADMSGSSISGNCGFEALSYNEKTGLFWTTTEATLGKDANYNPDGRQMLRLQTFTDDLKPAQRYLYLLDKPQRSSATAGIYAFGVPSILALDNGKLLVMEREAYIPSGIMSEDPLEIIKNAFQIVVYIKIYEVNPDEDNGGILKKRLVTSFGSSAFNFANYEGMCLGPVVNGKQTVLMVSDSQDRYKSLLKDYFKVITITGGQ